MSFTVKKIRADQLSIGACIIDNKNQKLIVDEIFLMNSKNLLLIKCIYESNTMPVEMILEKNSFINIAT